MSKTRHDLETVGLTVALSISHPTSARLCFACSLHAVDNEVTQGQGNVRTVILIPNSTRCQQMQRRGADWWWQKVF